MGQKYINSDTNGNIIARYDSEINPATQIPASALAVSDDAWRDTVDNPGKWLVRSGAMVASPNWPPAPAPTPPPAPDLMGFLRELHVDPNLQDAILGAILTDSRGALLLPSLQVGDFVHAQTLYNGLKANPPAGVTTANMTEVAAVAVKFHIPLVP